MNHNRSISTRLILVALVAVVLLIALIGLPGGVNSSAGQAAVARSPRPHPQSHIELASVATLSPRPHPISHLSFPPGIDLLNPRPHPESHIGRALNRPSVVLFKPKQGEQNGASYMDITAELP
jgi:hypothetical protein